MGANNTMILLDKPNTCIRSNEIGPHHRHSGITRKKLKGIAQSPPLTIRGALRVNGRSSRDKF